MLKCIFLITIFIVNIFANPIYIDSYQKQQNITEDIEYFLDKESRYSLNQIIKRDNLFKKSKRKKLLFGYKYNATLWIKVVLKNIEKRKVVKILEYDYPIQEKFVVYDINNNKRYYGGYLTKKFPAKYLTHPIRLELKPNETKKIILKAKNKNVGFIAKLNLLNPDYFEKKNENYKSIIILFLGSMIALIIYNLFILFLVKDITYFYYIIMVSSFTILILFINGFFPLYFKNFYMTKLNLYIIMLIMAYSMIMFTSNFLELPKKLPKINNILNIMIVSIFIIFGLNIIDILPTIVQRVIYLLLFILLIIIAIYAYKKDIKQAKYYIFGWSILLISAILLILNHAGISDLVDKFPHIGKLSVFSEAILFSMALSARINAFKDEKERVARLLLKQKEAENIKLEKYAEKKTEELRYAISEKEILLKELHHRVKNNLQIIISLLRLQSDKIENSEIAAIFTETENRIRALSSVHEMLYKDDNVSKIDAKKYLQILVKDISYSFNYKNSIKVYIISNANLSMDKAIYCGLIVNELITNSFKHAFKNGEGNIEVSLIEKPKEYELTISDNGCGIKDLSNFKKSLGLNMVKSLVIKQLKGNIEIESDNGTSFYITFKK